jgi:ferredoxin
VPTLTVKDYGSFDVPADKRLVNALKDDAGVDQLHACGGVGKCTTCRVRITDGLPSKMTVAEKTVREAKGLDDPEIRLSCQLLCEQEMTVEAISRFEGSGRKDAGNPVAPEIQPSPEWV